MGRFLSPNPARAISLARRCKERFSQPGKIASPRFNTPREKRKQKLTSTKQMSLLDPAPQGTDVNTLAVLSAFCFTTFSKKVLGVMPGKNGAAREGFGGGLLPRWFSPWGLSRKCLDCLRGESMSYTRAGRFTAIWTNNRPSRAGAVDAPRNAIAHQLRSCGSLHVLLGEAETTRAI